MRTATAIELMRAGYSDRYIAKQIHMTPAGVSKIRKDAGIPTAAPGPKPSTAEDRFWRLAQPVGDGHLLWPHVTQSMRQRRAGRKHSIRRIAFRIRWQREPVGLVTTGCEQPGCVHPNHVEDQPMREQYRAIFGEEAA